MVDLQDYRTELTTSLSDAWLVAKENAQAKEKQRYDMHTKESLVKAGDRVMVHMPGSVKGIIRLMEAGETFLQSIQSSYCDITKMLK